MPFLVPPGRWALLSLALLGGSATAAAAQGIEIVGGPALFAPGVASTVHADIRLTLSPDGRTALWFSRDRPGGPGGYDIWISRHTAEGWAPAAPAPFNSPTRDFDPAFSADGGWIYFCSDRPGGLGRDDIYRVRVTATGFGPAEHLGAGVNSAGGEWAPMLSPDGERLLFSSDRPGGPGRQDLYLARREGHGFATASLLPGALNTSGDEFDATFLSDGATIIYSRTRDLTAERVDLFQSSPAGGLYGVGAPLPQGVNDPEKNTYAPMLDWSSPNRLTFSAQKPDGKGMDLYLVRYRWSSKRAD